MFIVSVPFTRNSGEPATGLTLADINVSLYAVNKTTLATTVLWNNLNPTNEITGTGEYARSYTGEDFDTFVYYAVAEYTGSATLDSDHARGQLGDNVGAQAIWTYPIRTLTVPSAIVTQVEHGNQVNVYRGTNWEITFTTNFDLSRYTQFWFTLKENVADADANALVQINQTQGLLVINKNTAATPSNGELADTGASGNILVILDSSETALLPPGERYSYDIKGVDGNGDTQLLIDGRNLFTILPDISTLAN